VLSLQALSTSEEQEDLPTEIGNERGATDQATRGDRFSQSSNPKTSSSSAIPTKKRKRKDLPDSRDGDEDGVIPSFRELEAEVEALCDGKLSGEVVVCPKRRRSLKSQF
jgi:hypothetical protein